MEKSSNSNIDLIYDYTADLIKSQRDSITRLDTKLSTFLAFGGLTLRFALSLHSNSLIKSLESLPEMLCLIFKILSCGLALCCVIICGIGLTAKMRGITVDPKELMKDELFNRKEETNKGYIVSGWIKITDEYEMLGKEKGEDLNLAIIFIILSIVAVSINIITDAVFIEKA
ncbi:hypothetical protein A6770_35020 [Nostoc minutum NIES-26]|uniref:Uncharacterized protein n=1 Tax=Nostoc minutum NIES-26 TaxID=1844469 RepID=A0A367S2Y8_9NOSO|nr:hypothetical protein A6770_35020 [Nostoc minutum NIES-26]